MKLRVVNTPTGFVPETDDDAEIKRKLKRGATYEVTIKEVRNPLFNRKFFAMLNIAWDFLPEWEQAKYGNNQDMFRYAVEVKAGFCEMVYVPKSDNIVLRAKSIAFDKMSEQEFEKVYNGVREILIRDFIGTEHEVAFMEQIKWF
jgi:hypothetical protein